MIVPLDIKSYSKIDRSKPKIEAVEDPLSIFITPESIKYTSKVSNKRVEENIKLISTKYRAKK